MTKYIAQKLGRKGEMAMENRASNLAVLPTDVLFHDRRGFARLSPAKRQEISKAASAKGAAKGGSSIQTRTANLNKTGLFAWLGQPFVLDSKEIKLGSAADVVGVSRQCMRRWVVRHRIKRRKQGTTTLISGKALKSLHRKLQVEFKIQLITVAEAAQMLRLPIWEALPMLYKHVKKEIVDGEPMFYKQSVEAFVQDHTELIIRVRTGVLKL